MRQSADEGLATAMRALATNLKMGSYGLTRDAPEAARLYREDAASVAAREQEVARRKAAAPSRVPGRPTKRDRRALDDFLNEP